MKKKTFAILLTAALSTALLCSCNMESSLAQGDKGQQQISFPVVSPQESEKGETSTAVEKPDTDKHNSEDSSDESSENVFAKYSNQVLTPPTDEKNDTDNNGKDSSDESSENVFAKYSNQILTPPTEISSEISEPNDNDTDLQFNDEVVNVTTEQLSEIPANSTYAEIIDTLGFSANFGRDGLQLYKVDENRLLVLKFDNINDVCSQSGANLAKAAVSLKPPESAYQYLNSPDSTWYYGVMVDKDFMYSERGECCYSLSYTDMQYGIFDADGTAAEQSDINQNIYHHVLVDIPVILEIYPPVAEPSQIILIDYYIVPDP